MNNLYTGFFNSGIVTILLLLMIFSLIALLASWIRKILLPESKDSLIVDTKKAVKEELDRVLVPLANPLTPKSANPESNKVKTLPSDSKKTLTKNANKRRNKVS
jgi:hypothetical protein